jgi:toxin HigB-1
MIRTFKDAALRRFWNTGKTKGLPAQDAPRIKRILSSLNAATRPADMNLPGYKLHLLKGNRKGTYAVSVRANWRVTFEWEDGSAVKVHLEDYHGE